MFPILEVDLLKSFLIRNGNKNSMDLMVSLVRLVFTGVDNNVRALTGIYKSFNPSFFKINSKLLIAS